MSNTLRKRRPTVIIFGLRLQRRSLKLTISIISLRFLVLAIDDTTAFIEFHWCRIFNWAKLGLLFFTFTNESPIKISFLRIFDKNLIKMLSKFISNYFFNCSLSFLFLSSILRSIRFALLARKQKIIVKFSQLMSSFLQLALK